MVITGLQYRIYCRSLQGLSIGVVHGAVELLGPVIDAALDVCLCRRTCLSIFPDCLQYSHIHLTVFRAQSSEKIQRGGAGVRPVGGWLTQSRAAVTCTHFILIGHHIKSMKRRETKTYLGLYWRGQRPGPHDSFFFYVKEKTEKESAVTRPETTQGSVLWSMTLLAEIWNPDCWYQHHIGLMTFECFS